MATKCVSRPCWSTIGETVTDEAIYRWHPMFAEAASEIEPLPKNNEEEMKLVHETRKILHDPSLAIAATCVRVPVPIGHSESVLIETTKKVSAADARLVLGEAPGVIVEDDPHAKIYPTPHDVAGKDEVYVGRIRDDASTRHGLALWIVSDNVRKGAALNAVQIAEQAIEMGVLPR